MMHFDSWSDLWVMAGHGPYVWFCYAVFLCVLAVMVVHPLWRLAALKRRLKRRLSALESNQTSEE